MSNIFEKALQKTGQEFKISRNNNIIGETKGVPNYNKKAYDFYPYTDIKINDWLINNCNSKYIIIDKENITMGPINCIRAYILSEFEYNQSKDNNQPINNFNINTASNSIIGTQTNFTFNVGTDLDKIIEQINNSNSLDKKELLNLVEELKILSKSDEPIKKGMFSKFTETLQRNSWIMTPIANCLLSMTVQSMK